MPHVNAKPKARKPIFVQSSFSHSTFRAKTIHAAKPLTFSLPFLFRREQNVSNLTLKTMKCENRTSKKTALQNTLKNYEHRTIATLSFAAINRHTLQ